ncbi:DNL-type zinc finger protein [Morus notabilis]|uniref:DNL-type zinc finger protein n=1 Tax=Morus notabilis TaxID=981085 RepID=W9SI17_9ROSA|nr:uncharacterized protein LOC21396229 [Morus notabilis]EXC32926.1 DNL-type zinc finger protein [Morus notabilis]
MAVRAFQRRIASFLCHCNLPQNPLLKEPYWQFPPFAATFLSRYEFCKRGIQTQKEPISPAGEDLQEEDSVSVRLTSDSVNVPSRTDSTTSASDVKYSAASNLRASPRHDLAMIFTCRVCETRSVKTVCRESYEKGVVVVRCGGCNNLHLMADHLGWFGEPGSVEEFLAARGEEVKKGSSDTLSLTLEDLAGKKPGESKF